MIRDYVEFQERTVPLAYSITVRSYGTWLHGDKRGRKALSVARPSGRAQL